MSERDHYHEVADNLANAIAEYLSIDIGEHSSANCPWGNALDAIDDRVYSDTESMRKDAERYKYLIDGESGDVLYGILTGLYKTKAEVYSEIDETRKYQK